MNTVQISRGDLCERLKAKPLASGELFVHISKSAKISGNTVYDLVTRSFLTNVEKGDLFVGAGDDVRVYYIGSGGNLKWGGVLFEPSSYSELLDTVKQKPNTLFLYNGGDPLYTKPSTGKTNFLGEPQPEELTTFADGNHGESWEEKINPGDLIFYYPSLDQIIVLPLSRATDATTRIELSNLVSSSMTNLFKDTENVTLRDFLNKPVRHYQYLLDDTGWEPALITKNTDGSHSLSVKNDFDGAIHYVPFDKDYPGVETYKNFTGGLSDLNSKVDQVRQGDLILSLPADPVKGSSKAGVKHVVVSLYGEMLDQLTIQKGFERADPYATALWKNSVNGENETGYGITDHLGDEAFANKYKQVKDFIKRLFETKVDVDPTTGKIISSQLPDFLLGAPKYQGHLNISNTEWIGLSTDITPTQLITHADFADKFGIDWKNIDGNEDNDTSETNSNNVENSKEVNDKLKSGCYWIYTGDTFDISAFRNLFHLDSNKDDAVTGDNVNTDSNPDINSDDVAQHLINKGDWIIYNGDEKKFEIIDNSSSFVGILVHDRKVAGVAEFKEGERSGNYYDRSEIHTKTTSDATELEIKADSNAITFSGPKTVLFKNKEGDSLTSLDFFPVISADGFASNSRLGLKNNQRTINIDNLQLDKNEDGDPLSKLIGLNLRLADLERSEVSKSEGSTKDYINNAYGLWIDTSKTSYSFQKGTDDNSPATVTSFDFGAVSYFSQFGYGKEAKDKYFYGFDIASDKGGVVNLSLPSYDGVLTTEEYVNRGFTVTKLMIEDAISFVKDRTSSGNINWLQTIRYMKDEAGNDIVDSDGHKIKEIFDSAIKEELGENGDALDEKKFLKLQLHTSLTKTYEELKENPNSILSTYVKIPNREISPNVFEHTLDLRLKKAEPISGSPGVFSLTSVGDVYNPSQVDSEKGPAENILPNHSGILLNSNSVIDGGVWGEIEDEIIVKS